MRLWVQISAMVLVGVIVAGSALYFGSSYSSPFRRIYSSGEVSCQGLPTFIRGDEQVTRFMASRGDEIYVDVYLFQNGGDLSSKGMLRVEFREVRFRGGPETQGYTESETFGDVQIIENRISLGADMTMPVTVGPFYVKSVTPVAISYMNVMVFWNDDYLPCYDYRDEWRNV